MTRYWDPRLTARGANLDEYEGTPGTPYYKLISARWMDEAESQGKHHIFVDVLDEEGNRLIGVPIFLYNGGRSLHSTELKEGEPWAAAIPMYNAGHPFSITVADMSDNVERLGLGTIEQPMYGHHTSYGFIFQRAIYQSNGGSEPPPPPPVDPGDWIVILQIAEKIREIASKNTGPLGIDSRDALDQFLPNQSAFFQPELAAVVGSRRRPGWQEIAKVIGIPLPDGMEMAVCIRYIGEENE